MIQVAILGAGGLAREIMACFRDEVSFEEVWDDALVCGDSFRGVKVGGKVEDIPEGHSLPFVLAVGDPTIRKRLYDQLKGKKAMLETIIHPQALVFDKERIQVGEGCIVMPKAYLTTDIHLEDNILLHIGAGVHHDVHIKSHSVLMPGSCISCGFSTPERFFLNTKECIHLKNKDLYLAASI